MEEIIKTDNNAVQKIKCCDKCNMHFVSVPEGTVCRYCKAENVKLKNGLCYGCNCLKG